MGNMERGIAIKTEVDIAQIPGVVEQQFALLMLRHNPNLEVTYEPRLFEHTNGNGKQEGTTPDFYILNPKTGREIYVEITTQTNNGKDPKEKQRRVMKEAAPDCRYVVLYREHLERVQRAHPEINFFNGRKFREEE